VFGRWRPFFISEKMRLLRVLDLEGTTNIFDHHLMEIGMLIHLKYLSERGCRTIFHLPDSSGKLKQLQTLDVSGTKILKLPGCIIKLQKLQYIRAQCEVNRILSDSSVEELLKYEGVPRLLRNWLRLFTFVSVRTCIGCCHRGVGEDMLGGMDGDSYNRRDLWAWWCHAGLPFLRGLVDTYGGAKRTWEVEIPPHTLGLVNIARGKSILQEIKWLTQLRKLAVMGINKNNCEEFCSVVAGLSSLESLSVASSVVEPGLEGCLDGMSSSPPKSLESLKLCGNLVKLPTRWIGELQNLVKLKLWKTRLQESGAIIQVLGKLPHLAILQLLHDSFDVDKVWRLTFQPDGAGAAVRI
jgi:Leucine-rich repeat (LRR) protein